MMMNSGLFTIDTPLEGLSAPDWSDLPPLFSVADDLGDTPEIPSVLALGELYDAKGLELLPLQALDLSELD